MTDPVELDKEFLDALIKRANDGLEARRALQFYYPGVTNIVTVSGDSIPVDDRLSLETDLAEKFVLNQETHDV